MSEPIVPWPGTLGWLIRKLEAEPPDKRVPVGWAGLDSPHSYRGYYEDLEFRPKADVTVDEMLKVARSCVGRTFSGWKGGDYTMSELTDVWLGRDGNTDGDKIGPILLGYMLGHPVEPPEDDWESAG